MTYYLNGRALFPLRPARYTGTRRATPRLSALITQGAALGTVIAATALTGWYTTVFQYFT